MLVKLTTSQYLDIKDEMPFEYALYSAFLESREWVWFRSWDSGELILGHDDGGFEISGWRNCAIAARLSPRRNHRRELCFIGIRPRDIIPFKMAN